MQNQPRNPQPSRRLRRNRKKRRIRRLLFTVFLFSLIIGLSAIGYASWRVDHALEGLLDQTEISQEDESSLVEEPTDKTLTVLIMGRDFRPETGTNLTDVMIVAAIDMDHKKVSMVSIPRDTKVRISEIDRRVKANEAFNIGEVLRRQAEENEEEVTMDGPALAKKMAGRIFDISIDRYILVDFQSFMAIVDEVGGIQVDVERELIYNDPTDDTHINLQPGNQHLNGKEALDWVRHRHDDRGTEYYSSDFDRNMRQREVIKAVSSELGSFQGATKIFDVLDTMSEHIQTDLSKQQIKQLVWSFKAFDPNQIKSIETPNVYWDSNSLQTVIPEEDINLVHTELTNTINDGKNG